MKVNDLLKLIPEKELAFLAAETRVDHKAKKLDGITLFRLVMFSMLHSDKVSLRVMEHFYSTASFQTMSRPGHETVKFNSIRDRIATIDASFFEQVFNTAFERFNNELGEKNAILRYDTTLVTASAKLVGWALKAGNNQGLRKMKIAVGQKGSLPCSVKVFTNREAASEDTTIPSSIEAYAPSLESIVVFDRGVQSRKGFDLMSSRQQKFVGRLKLPARNRTVRPNGLVDKPAHSSVTVYRDEWVNLIGKYQKWTSSEFRLVEAVIDKTKEKIAFVTNIDHMDAYEVADIYKQRWDIEVLFKFLKQHLNLNHLVVRTENGIRVMLYMTLILAILIIAFKKKNKHGSYKIAKLVFSLQLEELIMKDIVVLCGGDPNKAKHLWNSS